MKLLNAVEKACGELPKGYHINLYMENGAAYIELFDYLDNEISLCLDDLALDEQVEEAIFAAKAGR